MNGASQHQTLVLLELGGAILGLAILSRLASRIGFSTIPLYLLAGLAFGKGGIAPLDLTNEFISVGAEIGVLLLLFMLGLEYTGQELWQSLRTGFPAGFVDLILNFSAGLVVGLLLGWSPVASLLLGGVTYISSSGIVAKVLGDLNRMNMPETPGILSILVQEDLAMAVYLPLVAVLVVGGSGGSIALSVAIALVVVLAVLFIAIRYGIWISKLLSHESDEVVLLSMLGLVLLVAGLLQQFQVSAAIGAFLVGITLSGPIAQQTHRLLGPLRDLFAATFFFFFGLEIDPAALVPVLPLALGLAVLTGVTKLLTGAWSARRLQCSRPAQLRAGAALIARGEFSMVIAGLGLTIEPQLGPLAAAYVLMTAVGGPLLARLMR